MSSNGSTAVLKKLNDRVREYQTLGSCMSLLEWDERTKMPKRGAQFRGQQLSLLAGMYHERSTSQEIGDLLSQLKSSDLAKDQTNPDAVNIREIARTYEKSKKLTKEFVEEMKRTTSAAEHAWAEARAEKNFKKFLPHLEKVIKLKKEQAEAYGYKKDPYDALIDDYEPGASVEYISKVFSAFREELVPFLQAIIDSGKRPDEKIIERDYPVDAQEKFGAEAAKIIGFDFESGRLDVTTHPFCQDIGPGDTRITTRYNPNHFPDAFFGILHEAGHGIYEQGLNDEYFGLPMGQAVSLGIHESQSRMWENQVGRSRAFWDLFYPKAKQHFPTALKDVSLDQFYWAVNDVRPSFIRVEADEVTYNLHIILRFELEHAMISGDLKPADVPTAWNEKFTKFFGITPPNDALGCMQDVHWSAGIQGYFPTYALGNLYAAQFFSKALADMPDMYDRFRKGDFAGLKSWLNKNIHSHGQRYRAVDLVKHVTGQELGHAAIMKHMKEKFGPLYGIS